jgi:hypothetical protein
LALDNKKTTDEIRLLVESKLKGEYTVLDNSKTLENNTMVYFVYFDREEGFLLCDESKITSRKLTK